MSDLRKNILVLVEHAGQGGAEKVAATLAQVLAAGEAGQSPYQVHYCALYKPERLPQIPGVAVSTLELSPKGGLLAKLQRYKNAVRSLRKFKKEHQIDLTISNLWPTDWLNFLTGKDRKIAVIHINILNNHQNRMMVKARRLVTFVYRGFQKIVLVGSNLQPELAGFFKINPAKLQVILNPVDVAQAARLAGERPPAALEALLTHHTVLVAVNRLSAIKNTEALLRIYRLLPAAGVKLLIVGEGEDKKDLQNTAQEAGLAFCSLENEEPDLTKDVFFAPFQKNVFAIFKRAKLFLFPTRGEGIPLVLLEAMSCGCPAIVSDCPNGGVSEIMQGRIPFSAGAPRTNAERATGGYLMPIPTNKITDSIWAKQIEAMLLLKETDYNTICREAEMRAQNFDIAHFAAQWRKLTATVLKNERE